MKKKILKNFLIDEIYLEIPAEEIFNKIQLSNNTNTQDNISRKKIY